MALCVGESLYPVQKEATNRWGNFQTAWVVDGPKKPNTCRIMKTNGEAEFHDATCDRKRFIICQL